MNVPTMTELYELAYAPGAWQCPKCGFRLQKSTLSVSSGEIGTSLENRQSEPCPNDGEFLVPVTWKMLAQESEKAVRKLLDRLEARKVPWEVYAGFMNDGEPL